MRYRDLLEAEEALDPELEALKDQIMALYAQLPGKWTDQSGREVWKGPESGLRKWINEPGRNLQSILDGFKESLAHIKATTKKPTKAQLAKQAKQKEAEGRRGAILKDMLTRAPRAFAKWLEADFASDPATLAEIKADPEQTVDQFEQWLENEHSMRVREDALVTFWTLDRDVRKMIANHPVALYHYTSSRVIPSIKRMGLDADRTSVNRTKSPGVYVTTETSGPAIDGYIKGAIRGHKGGRPVQITVWAHIHELEPDDDDADIQSGAHQFVMPHVPTDRIVSVEPWAL